MLKYRLNEQGITSSITISTNRYDRAVKRLVIPFSELSVVKEEVEGYMLPSIMFLVNATDNKLYYYEKDTP